MQGIVTIVFCCLFATTLQAEEIDRTVDAAVAGRVDISNISGSVTVSGWSRDAVEVTGTLGRDVEKLIVERDGDNVLIKVEVPKNRGRGIASELHINVPTNSSLDIGTVSADIEVTEVRGEQELRTVSGDVETEFTGAKTWAQSISGDIEVTGDGAVGEVKVSTVSGDTTVFQVSGEISAEAVSGDLFISDGSFSRAALGSVNGTILFHSGLGEDGSLVVDTVNGAVEIKFDGAVSARFDIETINGGIRNCFGPKVERKNRYGPGWELEFTEGDGSGRVEVSTVNGGVNICRQ